MIHLVLDTNILHQTRFFSRDMKRLNKLTNAGEVKIYIPEMVKREYISKRIDDAEKKLNEAVKRIKEIKKSINNTNETYEDLQKSIDILNNSLEKIEATVEKDFKIWVKELDIEILKFPMFFSIDNILNDYFSGNGVFSSKKNRKDIPDAIINVSINNLIKNKKYITVIINDSVFKKHLSDNNNISIFNTISEFLNSDKVKKISNHLDSSDLDKKYIKYILTDKFTKSIIDSFKTTQKILYFYGDKIKNIEVSAIKGDDIEISYSLSSPVEKAFTSDVEVLSKNTYSFLLNIVSSANIDYTDMPYHQYYYVKKITKRELYISSDDDNNSTYSVSEFVPIKATIAVTITLAKELSLDDFIKECDNIDRKSSILAILTEEYLVEVL